MRAGYISSQIVKRHRNGSNVPANLDGGCGKWVPFAIAHPVDYGCPSLSPDYAAVNRAEKLVKSLEVLSNRAERLVKGLEVLRDITLALDRDYTGRDFTDTYSYSNTDDYYDFTSYDLLRCNCEYLATWCKTGKVHSKQTSLSIETLEKNQGAARQYALNVSDAVHQ